VWTLSQGAVASDCIFALGDDKSLEQAVDSFHAEMAMIYHGAYEKGDTSELRDTASVLATERDQLMTAHFPAAQARKCPQFSEKATALSKNIDDLQQLVVAKADDEAVSEAFEAVHNTYGEMKETLFDVSDLVDGFHDLIRPLWHEAYPAKDAEAIAKAVPKLTIRAKLIEHFVAQKQLAHLRQPVADLMETMDTMKEAVAADDDFAILASMEQLHRVFHGVSVASGTHFQEHQ
jgi:hypothetical protein